jgi:hypothetical protein
MAIAYSERQLEEATRWREVSVSADAAEAYPVALPGERRSDAAALLGTAGSGVDMAG